MSRQLRDFPRPKVDLVLRYAREEAARQEARLEAFRGRAGGLLAFAAVLAALSVAAAADRGGSVLIFVGIVCIVVAAACFLGVSAGFRLTRNPEPQALARDYLYMDVEDIQMQILSNTLGRHRGERARRSAGRESVHPRPRPARCGHRCHWRPRGVAGTLEAAVGGVMTKTMFHDQAKLVRPKPAGPRPRATQLHAGLPAYDPRLSAPELRWYDLLLGRLRPRRAGEAPAARADRRAAHAASPERSSRP